MDSTVGAPIEFDPGRRAEQLLRAQSVILATLREGVVLFDRDGSIEFTNPAFDTMFGRDGGALTGTSVVELLEAGRRGRGSIKGVARLLKRLDARTGKGHVLFRRQDGTQFAGEVLSGTVDFGGAARNLVVIQDVSERKRLECQIIEVANRERRRQSSDLHDGLGQELTGISLMLRSLATRLGAAAEVPPELDEIIGLVNHAIQSARTMALGLSPVIRADGGLQSALATLAGWARANYHIDVRLRLLTPAVLGIDDAAATHLYLIAQEAINNAVKHGRARTVSIALRANDRVLSLTVADDGVGIDDNPVHTTGMGLNIMQYRAGMIGGSLRIVQPKQGGTRVRCVCPQVPESRNPAISPAPATHTLGV
jgi:two-component system CheB/CheR fusion protein